MAEASPNPTVFVTCIDDSILGRKRTQLNFWGRKDQNLMLQIEENLESIRHHRDQDPGTAQPADSVKRLRSKSTPHSLQLLLHKTISTAVNYLSFRHSHSSVNEIGPVLNEDLYGPEEIFGLITNHIITPSTKLEPAFQPRWTHYTATVPYETTLLNLKVVLNGLAAYALFESES